MQYVENHDYTFVLYIWIPIMHEKCLWNKDICIIELFVCIHFPQYKLEKSDYTAVRDTPAGWLDNFSMLKFAFSISSNITRLVQPIPPMRSQENAWKLQIWLVSLSQIPAKMRKINRPWPKCKQLKR